MSEIDLNDKELLQRLCNGALSRILNDNTLEFDNNANPILNSLMSAFAQMMKRRADKETQTGLDQEPGSANINYSLCTIKILMF